mgnify:CR=1 FL=1
MIVSFLLPRIPAFVRDETFSSFFSMVLYGQYVSLFSAIGLVLLGKRVRKYDDNTRPSK